MSLKKEIELNRDFHSKEEEVLLAMIHTSQVLDNASNRFLGQFKLTDTQFNALMIVRDYEDDGIRQVDLARRLLINRASVGKLIDKLCKLGYLNRQPVAGDRRAYNLVLEKRGREILEEILTPYYYLIGNSFGQFTDNETETVLQFLEKLRNTLNGLVLPKGE